MRFFTLALIFLASAFADETPDIITISHEMLAVEVKSISGEKVKPLVCEDDAKFAAVVFITTDCPIANATIPELNRLTDFVAQQGGRLTLAHVDWDLSREEASEHARDYQITATVVIDREHELVAATGAKVTPEVALVDPKGKVVYRGRINNLYKDFGDRSRVVTDHNLKDAISALVAGKPIETPRTRTLGCFIPDR